MAVGWRKAVIRKLWRRGGPLDRVLWSGQLRSDFTDKQHLVGQKPPNRRMGVQATAARKRYIASTANGMEHNETLKWIE